MAHKTHPKGFRLHRTEDWTSRWIDRKNYVETLKEDYLIRGFLEKKLKDGSVERIEIERFARALVVIIYSARPGIIIGRGGTGIEAIRGELQKLLASQKQAGAKKNGKREIRLEIREIKNPWESATLTAQWIAQQLEKRMPHRRVLKQTLGKVMANKSIQGARLLVAGRLGGADIARSEGLKEGRLPLQTLRADIDYGTKEAHTTYGVIGVKVWFYKGEKFEE